MSKNKNRMFPKAVATLLIFAWVFSGWPQISFDIGQFSFEFPPETETVYATTQTFTTAVSSTTWTAPAGVNKVQVECWGGGGGGGGDGSDNSIGSGGGGGGAYALKVINVTPSTAYTYTVGAAGAAGTAGPGEDGFKGGSSVFLGDSSTYCVAEGGFGGAQAATGGAGGRTTNSDGTTKNAGGAGFTSASTSGGGGGGSGGTGSAGTTATSITGATAVSGGGPGGNGGTDGNNGNAPASGPGGGGGGSGDRSGGAEDGGPGFAGQMRLIYTVINITQPDGVGDTIDEDDPFTVTFTLTDSDAVVTADFYYDTDNSGFDGTAIAGCQDQAEGTGATCVWDTTGVAVGTYYVYAVVTGGTTQPSIYSSGQVTIQGAPVAAVVVDFATSTPGRIGGALSFDGGDDSVNGGDIDGGGSNVRTIAFWMKAATTTASQPLINIDDTDPDYIDTDSSSNITANSFTATSIYVDGTTASANIPDLEWHHVVVTVSGGLTADNFQAASTTEGRFGGSIDDVRVYNKVLSFDEIQRLYKLGATTKVATTLNTQPTLETGLVGHWTFDGRDINIGTNTIIDRSGQGHHGFTGFMDTGTTTVPGRIGQALSFPQSNDYVRANNVTFPTTDFTYALWAKRYRSGFNEPFFSVRDTSDNPEVQLRYDNFAGNYTQVRLNNATIIEGIQTPQNTWVHYAFTRSGSDVRLYIDGEFSSSGLDGVALAPSSACGIIFARQHDVDTCSDTPSGNFDGALDDARIYNRALSADEVSRLYKLGATTKISTTVNTQPTLEDGLVGHWTFDGPDVDLSQVTAEARDSSGQGNHGNWIDHATTTVPGRIGQALDFDGSDDYVAFTPLVETKGPNTKFTLSAWVYPKGWSATANTVFGASAFGWNYMSITDTTIRHEVTNNPPTFLHTKAYDFELNNWYHVATTYDYNADQSKLYVNGTEVSSKTGLIDLNTSKIGGIGWYTNGTGAGYQFNGIIDDARVYNRALSADEIQRLYKLGK